MTSHLGVVTAIPYHVRLVAFPDLVRAQLRVWMGEAGALAVAFLLVHLDGGTRDVRQPKRFTIGRTLLLKLLPHCLPLVFQNFLHQLILGLHLLRDVTLCTHFHLTGNRLAHLVHGLLLQLYLQLTLVLKQQQIVLKLLLLVLLLLDSELLTLDLQVQLFLLREATDDQVSALALPDEMSGHVLEDRVEGLARWRSQELVPWVLAGQVVTVKDLVVASRDCRDGGHEPGLVGEVLLFEVDARGNLELLEVVKELLD